MKAVFISDAHIRDHEDPNLPPLLAFLDSLRGETERLYIVGDLFDTWFAFPRAVFEEYVPVLGALDRLHRSGVRIIYVTGNHDFEMGRFFTHILQAEVHESEFVLEADGRRAYVAHGDMVNPYDKGYRRLRRVLRWRFTRWLGRNLPPSWVWRIGRWMSRGFTGEKLARKMPKLPKEKLEEIRKAAPEVPQDWIQPLCQDMQLGIIFCEFAQAKLHEGFDTVVLGHSHQPCFWKRDDRIYANLGDWMQLRTFLRWEDGELSLWRWKWPDGKAERMQSGRCG